MNVCIAAECTSPLSSLATVFHKSQDNATKFWRHFKPSLLKISDAIKPSNASKTIHISDYNNVNQTTKFPKSVFMPKYCTSHLHIKVLS